MNNNNNTVVVALLALLIGLLIGYFSSASGWWGMRSMMKNYGGDGYNTMMQGGGAENMMNGNGDMLSGKTGDALDEAFLTEMIVHHEGAITMAKTLLASTKRPELIKLGNDIITAQTTEITMMKAWLKDWFVK